MTCFKAMLIGLSVLFTACSSTPSRTFYAAIVMEYEGSKLTNYELIGIAISKDACEQTMKHAAAVVPPEPGIRAELSCAPLALVATVGK